MDIGSIGIPLDLRVTCNHYLKNWMVGRGADPACIEVVHANIDSTSGIPHDMIAAQLAKGWV